MRKLALLMVGSLAVLALGCAPITVTPPPAATAVPAAPTSAAAATIAVAPTVPAAANKTGTYHFFDLSNLDVRDVPLLMAMDELQAQGYTVEKNYVANSTVLTEALARGDADLGVFNTQTAWTAIKKGAPIRTIAQFTGGTFVIASKADIQDCADLAGKRVGLAATSGTAPALLALYLKEECDDAAPEYLVIPESAGRRAALLAGELDASIMPVEEFLKIEDEAPGKYRVVIPLSKEFANVQVDAIQVRQGFAQEHPEMVKDFLRAMVQANRAVAANPQLLIDESVKRLELDPATAKKIAEAHLANKIWDANGGLTQANVQGTIDFYGQTGALDKGIQVEEVANLSFLNAILDELGRQ